MTEKSKILLIEDDADLVAAMKKILESKGYNIQIAYDPEEGNAKIKEEKPDLIILDVMFGNRGESRGFDFANSLRINKELSDIPVLMLTAINTERPFFKVSPETDGEFLPVDEFLDKPVKYDELFQKVENLLNQKVSKWRNWPEKTE